MTTPPPVNRDALAAVIAQHFANVRTCLSGRACRR